MQMSSRVRRSWNDFGDTMSVGEPTDVALAFRAWIRSSLIHIARPASEAIAGNDSIQRLLQTPLDHLPTSLRAIEAAKALSRTQPPSDPIIAVDLVGRAARGLTVYRLPEDRCPECQGGLDVWTSLRGETELLLECDLLGCVWSLGLNSTTAQLGPLPPARASVVACYPDADIVAQRSVRPLQ